MDTEQASDAMLIFFCSFALKRKNQSAAADNTGKSPKIKIYSNFQS